MSATSVRVDRNLRGSWDVALPGQGKRLTCGTLEEADRVAHQLAAGIAPRELVICDAYHRVVHRELIKSDGHGEC